MDQKVANICANIKMIMGDVSYERLLTIPYTDELYTNLVKHIMDPKRRLNKKKWVFSIIKRNTGNVKQFFRSEKVGENLSSLETRNEDENYTILKNLKEKYGSTLHQDAQWKPTKDDNNTKVAPSTKTQIYIESDNNVSNELKRSLNINHEDNKMHANFDFSCLDDTDDDIKTTPSSEISDKFSNNDDHVQNLTDSSYVSDMEFSNLGKNVASCQILPKGSQNVKDSCCGQIERTNYSKCCVFEGECIVSKSQWNSIIKYGKLISTMYPNFFRHLIHININNSCNIAFYRVKYRVSHDERH